MNDSRNSFKYVLMWLVPTGVEVAVYLFITFFTIILCSQDIINNLLFASGDFNPIRAGIAGIDSLLQYFLGEKIAGSLSLAIFWGMVGLIVNLLWWLGSNFSTELNNDLVYSKYVHPQDTDPKSQLREFIEKTVIRTTVAVIALIYANFFVSQGLPGIATRYADIISSWDFATQIVPMLTTIFFELLMLHAFVVLARMILLRKQILNSN